jgi:hypothetical protein
MVVGLFLLLVQGIAFRRLNIVCSLFRGQGQIFFQKADDQANQPNHIMIRDKHRCKLRLQRRNPNQQHWMFREFQVSVALQPVPKLYGRYVQLQLAVLFENQGLLAKNFTCFFMGRGKY